MNEKHNKHTQHDASSHAFHGMEASASALKVTGWLTGIYFIIELGLGFYSGSIAVISDAFHTFSAVGGVLIALIANRIATRTAEKSHTFGMMRAEIVGALLNGVFLLLMAIYVLWMGYNRLQETIEIPTNIMFLSATGGLITEFIAMGVMWKSLKGNLNMQGAFWHIIQTFVGSIIIIIAAIIIQLTGWYPIDPILGMLFGLVLFWASLGIIKETFNIFLEATPKNIDVDKVIVRLKQIKDVEDIHHIHAWTLTSGKDLLMGHVKISNEGDHEKVLSEAYTILKKKFGFYFTTLQVEKKCNVSKDAEHIDYLNKETL